MNRRNFILGLGTAATLSGAASVTGAAVSGSVDATAEFSVVAEDNLVVEKSDSLSDSTMNTNQNYSTFLNDGDNTTGDYVPKAADDLPGQRFPNLTIDDGTNSDLDIALAIENANTSFNRNGTNKFPGGTPYDESDSFGEAPLQIFNPGDNAVDVGVEYAPGSSGLSSNEQDLLVELFTFSIDTTQVSPDEADTESTSLSDGDFITTDNSSQVDSGETAQVNFQINMSTDIANALAEKTSGSTLDFDGAQTAVDLLDEVRFGTQ
jgi:hypothetical protein